MMNETNGSYACPVCDRPLPLRPLLGGDGNGGTCWFWGRYCNVCHELTERRPGEWARFDKAESALTEAMREARG